MIASFQCLCHLQYANKDLEDLATYGDVRYSGVARMSRLCGYSMGTFNACITHICWETRGVPRVSGCSYSTGEVLNYKLIGYQFFK